jgi:hypothetical protein
MRHRRGLQLGEQVARASLAVEHGAFGHAVVQQGGHGGELLRRQLRLALPSSRISAPAGIR